jgi:two-component system, cell cycle sensor histidine kinase and response regulator CckA
MAGPSPDRGPSSRRALLVGLAAFVLSAIPVALASALLDQQQRSARADETRMLAEQASLRIADFVRARFLALEIVRLEAAGAAFVPDERFDSIAAATEAQYGGFQAINWVDAEGVIRRVVPREPNLPALGRNLLLHAPTQGALASAIRAREPRATPPIDLLQGGRGFGTYFPVVRGVELTGAVNGVFRIDDLVEGCFGDALLARYVVVIEDGDSRVYGEPAELEGEVAILESFSVLDREWRLRIGPRASAENPHVALYSFAATGFAFAIALSVFAFLTARRQQLRLMAEREQRKLEQRLAGAQRLEGLGRLAGGIAHDFNNLLAVILAGSEHTLRAVPDLPADARASLEDARTAADRAAGLTRQLLAFSREQPRVARRLDLGDVVRTTERMLRRLLRADVELQVHGPDAPVWIVSDAAQLTQVLVNLVMNAADAIAGSGHIDVSVGVREGAGPREPGGKWAVLEVKDDGPGIAAEHVDRIFEPFYTTKGEQGGTGLGLATVYGLLQQHGGHLTVESSVGSGATFRAFFPLASETESKSLPGEASAEETPKKAGDLVLLIEDDALLRRAVTRTLTDAGCRVVEATDGADGLARLEKGLAPDVVITDLVMPRMGGLDLIRSLRARGLETPVILVSGYADVDVGAEELERLGVRFVPKPYTAPDLIAAIGAAIRPDTVTR